MIGQLPLEISGEIASGWRGSAIHGLLVGNR